MRLCQTIAFWTGLPVDLSQTTVVSRWLVMPMAAMSSGEAPASAMTCFATAICESQIASGSCSTWPGDGKICGNSWLAVLWMVPSALNRIARLEVVPWSRARTYLAMSIAAFLSVLRCRDQLPATASRSDSNRMVVEVAPGSWWSAARSPR